VGTARAYDIVRSAAPRLERDRALAPEIERAAQTVADGAFADVMRSLRDERAADDDERLRPPAACESDETPGQATRH
jgi:hypothetical protein